MNHLGALQLTKDTQKSGTPGDILRASYPFERSLLAKILRFRGGVRKIKMARLGRHGGPTFGGTNRFSNHTSSVPDFAVYPHPRTLPSARSSSTPLLPPQFPPHSFIVALFDLDKQYTDILLRSLDSIPLTTPASWKH
jgi:hypothetical protein